ncbi:MAG: IS30 family transposase [Acidimicrobiales bacterium]
MPANPLTMCEREEIRAGIERGETDVVIAGRLGRCRTTVNQEINRNGGRAVHTAVGAQARADVERERPKVPKPAGDPVVAAQVTARLEAKDSPMTIARELAGGVHGVTALISHECIYAAVYAHGRRGLRAGLHKHLHRRRRCRKRRVRAGETPPVKASPLGEFNLIHSRPEAAAGRGEVGHFEGDLILGSFNRSALVTVFDRASRNSWLADLPDGHDADETLGALIELFERMPARLRRTLTWDQGSEMARHADLAATVGIDVFFAEPHSPWQRPTNENGNGLIRRYVGKGTKYYASTEPQLEHRQQRLH